MTTKAWSEEDTLELERLYEEEGLRDPEELGKIFGRGYRSVISKLVQLKIYVKPEAETDLNKPRTVKAILRTIERILKIQIDGSNINKKENLVRLVEALEKLEAEHLSKH